MYKEALKQIILESQEKEIPRIFPRDIEIPLDSTKPIAIAGPRRSGKTFLCFALIKALQESNIPKEAIAYINFEDPRIYPADATISGDILAAYWELYPEMRSQRKYLFLDEVQVVNRWELLVRRLYDTKEFSIIFTGSSSKLLGKEIATEMRGRALTFELLPLSFREALSFRGIPIHHRLPYSQERFSVQQILSEYLEYGGFPEIVLEEDKDLRIRILREYLQTMFLRDIFDRFRLRNRALMQDLIRFLATNIAQPFSVNSLYRFMKLSQPLTKRTLLEYSRYLEEAYLFAFVRKYSPTLKEQFRSLRKCYIIDHGLRLVYGFRFSDDRGKTLENAVFLELRHRKAKNPLLEIFYWKDPQGHEVDFVVTEGAKIQALIQVSADITHPKTREREIRALVAASRNLQCENLTVITLDVESQETVENRKIFFQPFWKWALGL